MYNEEIGKRLKAKRLDLLLRQKDISEKTELAPYTVKLIEKGFVPMKDNFLKICSTLNTTPQEILNGTGFTLDDIYGNDQFPRPDEDLNAPPRPYTDKWYSETQRKKREQQRYQMATEAVIFRQHIIPYIRDEICLRGLTQQEIANMMGTSLNNVNRALSVNSGASPLTFRKYLPGICEVLDIPWQIIEDKINGIAVDIEFKRKHLIEELTDVIQMCDIETLEALREVVLRSNTSEQKSES